VVANDGKSISQGLSEIRLLTVEKLYCKKWKKLKLKIKIRSINPKTLNPSNSSNHVGFFGCYVCRSNDERSNWQLHCKQLCIIWYAISGPYYIHLKPSPTHTLHCVLQKKKVCKGIEIFVCEIEFTQNHNKLIGE
jgi:hypothetical protein